MEMNAPNRLTARPLRIAAAALALLLVTVALGLTLGIQTRAQFREVEASWLNYAGGAERKGMLISEIRGYLGYGGIIHNFKNYVLRQDAAYLAETEAQIARFRRAIERFRALDLSAPERAAIADIEGTILTYEAKLPHAKRAAREGWPPARTDPLVRVDDTRAIAALAALEDSWRQAQTDSTARIFAAVSEGKALIWIGFAALAALFLAASVIGGLLYLLVRDLRQAVADLERELAERHRLERAQARLATVVEQSPATIVMTDTHARIEYVNAKFEELTGWRRDEVLGHTPAFLQSGDTGAETYAQIRKTLATGQKWHGVFRNTRKDGSSYWAETTLLPLLAEDGTVRNYVGIGEDVTEARRARDQMVRAQKLEAVGQLAGGVAHDFNNILTTIVGSSHLAAMDAPEGSEIAGEIEQIGIAARRAQHLVRELLTFARREPGEPQPVALQDVVREVAVMLRASVPPVIAIETPAPGGRAVVMGDPTHLHQIVMNLCRNAAEAMGGVPGTITVTITKSDPPEGHEPRAEGWLCLCVRDDGPGMTAETLAHLFEPFFTTKPIGKGSGLGLAVVFGLVEEMGGHISVDSTLDKGTTFEVVMPATAAEVTDVPEPTAALPRGNERILLVDDETEVAGTFRRQLMRLGYRVDAYTSPLIARERFRTASGTYDLAVLDVVMPDLNGQELAESLRALRPDLPVIFCSGYRPDNLVLTGIAPDILEKPVDPGVLARQVRAALDRAVTSQER